MLSIKYLFELRGMGPGMGRGIVCGARRQGVYNAPMFAWSVYHGKIPPFIPGRTDSHASVLWNGIDIDSKIPLNIVKELNTIPDIIVRASCQGHTGELNIPDVNTYMIFRTKNQDVNYVKEVVSKLNKHPDIKAGFGLGMMQEFRIAVVGSCSYDSDPIKFKRWWVNLPKIIKKAL